MKNSQTLWDILILLLIMCAGLAGVTALAKNNQDKFDYRFPDKSLIAGAPVLDNDANMDPNLKVHTLKDTWDFYLSPAEVYALLVIQDYTCPVIEGDYMKLHVGDKDLELNHLYEFNIDTTVRNAVNYIQANDLTPYPNTTYYLDWNTAERRWDVAVKMKEYNFTTKSWEDTRP